MNGLKEEISSIVYLHKPITLKDARDKARAKECVEAMEKKSRGVNRQPVNFTGNVSKNWSGKISEAFK